MHCLAPSGILSSSQNSWNVSAMQSLDSLNDSSRTPKSPTKQPSPLGRVLINRKRLLAMVPLCDRTIYNLERKGKFPQRIALSSRSVAWDLGEVEDWIEHRRASGAQAMRPGSTPTVS